MLTNWVTNWVKRAALGNELGNLMFGGRARERAGQSQPQKQHPKDLYRSFQRDSSLFFPLSLSLPLSLNRHNTNAWDGLGMCL